MCSYSYQGCLKFQTAFLLCIPKIWFSNIICEQLKQTMINELMKLMNQWINQPINQSVNKFDNLLPISQNLNLQFHHNSTL